MVIGERFAWAHLPKTGGDATLAMFGVVDDLVLFADPADGDAKHTLFRDREEQIAGRLLVMNLRRLPAWVLSRAHHVNRRGLAPEYRPLPMPSPHEMAESGFPDHRLGTYTDEGRFEIAHWLRLEHLAEDFLAFASGLRELSETERERVTDFGRVNEGEYDRDLGHWFTGAQVERMYERNPVWAALERRLYGGLMSVG